MIYCLLHFLTHCLFFLEQRRNFLHVAKGLHTPVGLRMQLKRLNVKEDIWIFSLQQKTACCSFGGIRLLCPEEAKNCLLRGPRQWKYFWLNMTMCLPIWFFNETIHCLFLRREWMEELDQLCESLQDTLWQMMKELKYVIEILCTKILT